MTVTLIAGSVVFPRLKPVCPSDSSEALGEVAHDVDWYYVRTYFDITLHIFLLENRKSTSVVVDIRYAPERVWFIIHRIDRIFAPVCDTMLLVRQTFRDV